MQIVSHYDNYFFSSFLTKFQSSNVEYVSELTPHPPKKKKKKKRVGIETDINSYHIWQSKRKLPDCLF